MKRTLLSVVAILALTLGLQAQWIEQNTGFSTASRGIQFISIVNSNVVWATAYDGTGSGAVISEFTRTVNGGTLWTPGQVLTPGTYGLGNISAINADTAWVSLYNGAGNQDNNCGVYRTNDGGVTWTHQTGCLQGSSSFADNVHFWDGHDGMAHGDVKDGYFEIYWTSDGGTTWTRVPKTDINGSSVSGEGGWTTVINAVGDSMISFGTNKGNIYISNDRGHHWFVKATGITPANSNGGINQIAFTDPLNGMVAQGNNPGNATDTTFQLYKTTDGGHTWTHVTGTTGWIFGNCLAGVPGTANTYVTGGANVGSNQNYFIGSSYTFDGTHFTGFPGTVGQGVAGYQFLYTSFLNDSTGWSGHFNQDATTGGIWKFNGVLAAPVANFVASDSAITLGSSVTFTNLSTGDPYSTKWTFTGGSPATYNGTNPPAITYNTPGDFTVSLRVTSDYGADTLTKVNYIHVGGVGINEVSNVTLTISPNPAKDYMKVSSSVNIQEVQIMNLVGQTIINQTANGNEITINTSNLNSGVYLLRVKINDKFYNNKIVVK